MPINLSGSLELTGSLVISGSITTTGPITISGSIASSSFVATASSADNFLTRGTLTAQTLVVQTITSSIVYSSGSNIFGNQLTDVQQMTGSLRVTGSLSLNNIAIPTSASLASTYLPLAGGTLTGALSGTSATFKVNADRNLAIKYDTNIAISAQNDGGNPESVRYYADTFRIFTATTSASLAERFTISNTGAATFAGSGNGIPLIIQDISAAPISQTAGYIGMSTSAFSGNNGDLVLYPRTSATSSILLMGGNVSVGNSTTDATLSISGDNSGGDSFLNFKADLGVIKAQIQGTKYAGTGGQILFKTLQSSVLTEAMRINQTGLVCIGTTGVIINEERLSLSSAGNTSTIRTTSTGGSCILNWNSATSGNNSFMEFGTEGGFTVRGSITYNRGSAVTAYNTTSDYRLKSEINDFNALEIISNLKPKEFRIGDAINKSLGFIAHELQEYLPQAVSGKKDAIDKDGKPFYQGVDYSQLTGLLTKAIQELSTKLEEATTRINALESK